MIYSATYESQPLGVSAKGGMQVGGTKFLVKIEARSLQFRTMATSDRQLKPSNN